MNKYTDYLFSLRDDKYKAFNEKLIPNINADTIIGVRVPQLRRYAKELLKTGEYIDFINNLPHTYLEENQLHVFIVSQLKDYDEVIKRTEEFLPDIDNWAVCDGFNPKCFSKNKEKLYKKIKEWISSGHIYTRRFAIDMLMGYYLGDDFSAEHLSLVALSQGEDYYLKMVIAWYFATALAKQYDETIKIIEDKVLEKWIHNKTIQKAVESYRISEDKKAYLKRLKIK